MTLISFPIVNLRALARLSFLLVALAAVSEAELTHRDGYAVVHGWPEIHGKVARYLVVNWRLQEKSPRSASYCFRPVVTV